MRNHPLHEIAVAAMTLLTPGTGFNGAIMTTDNGASASEMFPFYNTKLAHEAVDHMVQTEPPMEQDNTPPALTTTTLGA